MAIEKIDLTCPKCGGVMEQDKARSVLHCPYCGHEALLRPAGEEAARALGCARQQGVLQANAEARKAKKRKKALGALIALCVLAFLVLAAALYNALQPKVDPFACIAVSFTGENGEGTAEVQRLAPANGVDPASISYSIEPRHYLSLGDIVTVTASSSDYRLSPTSKTYVVEGLDTCLTDLSALSEKAMLMIHNKSDITLAMATEGAGSNLRPQQTEPVVTYLTTDGDGNTLYDVYKVLYPEPDGGAAERYFVIYYTDIIVRDTAEPTMSYRGTMYTGQIIKTLDRGYGGYVTAYFSLKDVKADILSHQNSAVTLQERAAGQ